MQLGFEKAYLSEIVDLKKTNGQPIEIRNKAVVRKRLFSRSAVRQNLVGNFLPKQFKSPIQPFAAIPGVLVHGPRKNQPHTFTHGVIARRGKKREVAVDPPSMLIHCLKQRVVPFIISSEQLEGIEKHRNPEAALHSGHISGSPQERVLLKPGVECISNKGPNGSCSNICRVFYKMGQEKREML